MIVFKFAMRTEDGTRMFRAVMDGQVCIRPEWMFDPFQEAVPCWLEKHKAHASSLANRWITNMEAKPRSSWTEQETSTYNGLISED